MEQAKLQCMRLQVRLMEMIRTMEEANPQNVHQKAYVKNLMNFNCILD
jgi:hypothetical protein